MDSFIIVAAFACGFAARQIGQPPMVGYLIAGFGLGIAGFESSDLIQVIADAGISMMLFIIGLKLDLKSLLRPEIYRSTLEHGLSFGLVKFWFFTVYRRPGPPPGLRSRLATGSTYRFCPELQLHRLCRGDAGRAR